MSEIYQTLDITTYRNGGPSVFPMSRSLKAMDKYIYLNKAWVNFIFGLNNYNSIACSKIVAPDYGPSQGYNSNGLLKYLSLVYGGRNIVSVTGVITYNGIKYATIYGIPMNVVPQRFVYSAYSHPHLVHKLYGVSRSGLSIELTNTIYAPLLGGPWYLPLSNLRKIVFPKDVSVNQFALNVRSTPNIGDNLLYKLQYGQVRSIVSLVTGNGGIWGQLSTGGWIALRYNGINNTSWSI